MAVISVQDEVFLSRSAHFGRDVRQTAATLAQHASLAAFFDLVHCAQSEVADLERPCGVQKEILRLEVAMAHAFFMEITL